MLPKIHEYTGHFYFPFSAAVGEIARKLRDADVTQPASFNELTYFLLLFRKRSRVLFERVGGWYLTTRLGEQLISECEDAFVAALSPQVPSTLLREAKDSVGRYMEFHIFSRQGLTAAPVVAVRQGLINWKAADPAAASTAAILTDILADVLDHEVNLTYRFWYDSPVDPPPERDADIAALRASGNPRFIEIAEYERYRREMKKRKW
jgi:hypothetical protein